jgi:thiol-disulfide isomerase/thioredoxin
MKTIKIATMIASLCLFCNVKSFANNPAVTAGKVYEIVDVSDAVDGKIIEFFFNDDKGKKQSINKIINNKYTFLNIWGTWCPPCRAEIPDIIELQKDLKDKDFVVIGVAVERDKANALKNVSEFAARHKMNYVNFVVPKDKIELEKKLLKGINAFPTTFIASKSNEIFEIIVGQRDKATFLKSINKLMESAY